MAVIYHKCYALRVFPPKSHGFILKSQALRSNSNDKHVSETHFPEPTDTPISETTNSQKFNAVFTCHSSTVTSRCGRIDYSAQNDKMLLS